MPLHKSSRAPRLDPTMISAPLGDFRHTMHIGRGGDAFGDTSFLSTLGPRTASSDSGAPEILPAADSEIPLSHSDPKTDGLGSPPDDDLQHSESVSSFTLDLDLDLGPSILGDVLGVMDGLGLNSEWTNANEEEVFGPSGGATTVETKQGKQVTEEVSLSEQNEKNSAEGTQTGDSNGINPKGLRPKVRFSDKREEIMRQASEEEGHAFDFQDEDKLESRSPTVGESDRGNSPVRGGEAEFTSHNLDRPPSPASSQSSEYEGVTSLDRRRVNCQSETDSEEEEVGDCGRGYTFEDEFDDEIGL